MNLTTLTAIADRPANQNMQAFMAGMAFGGSLIKWERPVVQAHVLGQVLHESGGFTHDREIWGPTEAQKRYEDRADLGHSAAAANEAWLFRGKGPLQNTGRANHVEFRDWCRQRFTHVPDFERDPEAMLADPWEGMTVVWYWSTRNLTTYALANDFLNVTRRINGGYNGLEDREKRYARAGLILLGKSPSVAAFQREQGMALVDGVPGPKTRALIHAALMELPDDKPADNASSELDKLRDKLARISAIMEE